MMAVKHAHLRTQRQAFPMGRHLSFTRFRIVLLMYPEFHATFDAAI